MNEIDSLKPAEKAAVECMIVKARKADGHHSQTIKTGEAYAYRTGNVIHWGFNDSERGWCVARGVVS